MSRDYILTLEAIDRRLYSKDKTRPLARFSASDLSLPRGNHTKDGLSEECLTYMTELLTRHGRPNLQMNHFLFLHFGGWDALMEYIQADPKRRGFLLRCEEKGYSVASERALFDRMLVDGDPDQGEVSASASMHCILEANTLIVHKYCGIYSGKSRQDLRDEIEGFLQNSPEEEKGLVPQMNLPDRYAIYRHIRSMLEAFDEYCARGEDEKADRSLGTALTWLLLAALLRDSCRCLCSLLPQNIQILKVEERESRLSGLPAVASVSQPPRSGRIFKGRQKELEWIGDRFRHRQSPLWITGDGGCGKTSLALQYASQEEESACLFASFHEDLFNTIAEVRFQDRLRWEEITPEELFEFHISRIARYGSRLLLIIDNFDADRYDRTFFEMLGSVCHADPEGRSNGDILDLLCRTGANILFTTRLFVPPQYPSICLSEEEHLLTRAQLTELAKEIYDDGEWTEEEEVMMEEIILSVGKHVMVVELIAAALKYNAGFSTVEEVLAKVRSGRYARIGAGDGAGRGTASDVYSRMTQLFSFSAFTREQQLLLRILSLLPTGGLDRGLFMELSQGTFRPEVLRGMLLRFRDLHLASVGKTVSMHPVTADLAGDKLLPDAENCGDFIRRSLAYYEQYSEKNYDYRLLAQISRLLMRFYFRLRENEQVQTAGEGTAEKNHDQHSFGESEERALAAWKVSLIEYELGHPLTALQWALAAERAAGQADRDSSGADTKPALAAERAAGQADRDSSGADTQRALAAERAAGQADRDSSGADTQRALAAERAAGQADRDSSGADTKPVLPAGDSAFLASVCKAAAQAEAALGRFEDALMHYRRAIALQESLQNGGIPEIAITYNDLAVALYEMDEFEQAEDLLERALQIQTEYYGPDSIRISTTYNNLGLLSSARGEHELAVTYYEKSLLLQKKCYGEMHPGTAVICCNLGQEYSELSQMDKAQAFFDRALRINKDLFGEDCSGNAGICNNVGLMHDELARQAEEEGREEDAQALMDQAFHWYWKALSILDKNYGTENPHRADLYSNLAAAYLFSGDTENGYHCFETAAAILEKIFGPDHPRTQAVLGDYAAAREWFEEKS